MIEKIDGYNVFQCEVCDEEQGFLYSVSFRDATEQLKQDGWEIWKNGDTWEHFCCEECRRVAHLDRYGR
jgi:hypothetical protein